MRANVWNDSALEMFTESTPRFYGIDIAGFRIYETADASNSLGSRLRLGGERERDISRPCYCQSNSVFSASESVEFLRRSFRALVSA